MISLLALTGCSQSVQQYAAQQPALDLRQFFQGHLNAYGVMHDWKGQQGVRFSAQLCGQWQGNSGDLYEIFQFSDGRIDKRHWRLTQLDSGVVTGSAADVVGGAHGELAGNSLYWQYVLRIPSQDGSSIDVTVKDWLYLVTPDQLINRSTLHKFGLTVGELTLSIQRQPSQTGTCAEFIDRYRATTRTIPLPPSLPNAD
jgi:hypothetical protein